MSKKKDPPNLSGTNFISDLKFDIPSGLVVFLVALPLCLGIALASEAPLFSGIIAGIVGGIVVGYLSGSPLSVSGPAAGLTSIVAASIASLGSFEAFLVAVCIAGVFQIILGVIRAGFIGYFFPTSVIEGMLAAIGLILILKQIPHAFGYDLINEGAMDFVQEDGLNTFNEPYYAFKDLVYGRRSALPALLITLVSLAILIIWERPFFKTSKVFKIVPSPLIVVFVGILINYYLEIFSPGSELRGVHLVRLPVFSDFEGFKENLAFPDFKVLLTGKEIYMTGITIALVASIESLLSVEAVDKLDPYRRQTPTNRELIAQGIGNLCCGLIGGLPVTAVIVRSSANVSSGGRTKKSAIIHGIFLLVCVSMIPALLNYIPKACLSGILLIVGYKLARITLFKHMYEMGWSQFLPFVITITAILMTDLLRGVGIGLAVGLFFILRNNFRSPIYHFEESEHDEEHELDNKVNVTLSEDVSFLNKASIRNMLKDIPENSEVIIDGSRTRHIDFDIIDIFEDYQKNAIYKNIQLKFKGIKYFEKSETTSE